jgi:oxygen-dependent protoporphyrinogen oxidase
MPELLDTIVVGAGIAGLSYAHARGPDADLTLLESSDRAGGVIVTEQAEGCRFEYGPEALQDNAPETLALLDELGLEPLPSSPAAARRWILLEPGRLVPVPMGPGALLGSSLLSFGAKLRVLKGLLARRPDDLGGSLADFVRSRFGEQVLQRVVDPVVSGIYAGDPELISLEGAFPRLHAMLSEHGSILAGMRARARASHRDGRPGAPGLISVSGGLQSIPRALAAALGERLVLSCPVSSVARMGDAWSVHTADGARRSCSRLVLALPAAAAAKLLMQSQPSLSQALGRQRSESVLNLVHVWRRQDIAHPLDGFGYLVPSSLGAMHLGTLFSSSIQPGCCPADRVVLRTLLGGARRPEMLDLGQQQLLDIVRREVGETLGLAPGAELLFSRRVPWPSVLPRYDLDHPSRQATIDTMLEQNPGLAIIGNHRRGISVNALIESSRALAHQHNEVGVACA